MSVDFDGVVGALARLTSEERAAVAARIKAMQSLAPPAAPTTVFGTGSVRIDGAAQVDAILAAVARVSLRMCGERVAPAALRRGPDAAGLRDKAPAVSAFLRGAAADKVARAALLDLGLELLYKNLAGRGYPASARTLVRQIHRLPAVVDAAFPGYARAGLLGMVLAVEGRDKGGGDVRP